MLASKNFGLSDSLIEAVKKAAAKKDSQKEFDVKPAGSKNDVNIKPTLAAEEKWIDVKTKKVVQASDRNKAAQLLNTNSEYIRKAPITEINRRQYASAFWQTVAGRRGLGKPAGMPSGSATGVKDRKASPNALASDEAEIRKEKEAKRVRKLTTNSYNY